MTEATNSTTAQTPAPAAAAANRPAPKVEDKKPAAFRSAIVVGGQTFELAEFHGRNAQEIAAANARGQALYDALPAEYKKQADEVTKFVGSYRRIVALTGEAGGKETMDRYWEWVAAGGKAGKDGANVLMGKIDEVLSEHVSKNMPAYRQRQVAGSMFDFAGGLFDGGLGAPGRLFTAGGKLGGATIGEINPSRISPEQARTFGAVYAGTLYDERQHNASLPMIDWPWSKEGSQLFNSAGPFLTAALRYVGALLSNAWSAVVDKKAFEMPDFGMMLAEETFRKENGAVAKRIDKSGNVAGLSQTQELSQSLQGAVTAQRNGNLVSVTAGADGLKIDPVNDGKGQQVTAMGKAGDDATREFTAPMEGKTGSGKAGYVIGTGIGTAATLVGVAALPFAVPAVARNVAHGFKETYENKPVTRAAGYLAKAETLQDGFSILHPSTWASEARRSARADYRVGQALEQFDVAGNRMATGTMEAVHERLEVVEKNSKTNVFRRAATTVADVVRRPGEIIGNVAGWVADKTSTMTSTIVKDTAILAGDAKAVASGVNATMEGAGKFATRVASGSHLGLRGLGIVGTVVGAAGDTMQGVEASANNDGHGVVKAVGRVGGGIVGGLAGGAASGAAAGAAIGVWFGGITAIPAAIIGGVVGLVGAGIGGWLGATGVGAAAEYVAGDAVHNAFYRDNPPAKKSAPAEIAPGTQAAKQPAGALGASDKGIEDAVKAMAEAKKQRLEAAVAGSPEAVAAARMAANRMPFAKVTSSQPVGVADLGSFKLDGVPQAERSFAELAG